MKIPYIREMQKPLVSILTPFKNTRSFITECLHSISAQSYKNWELIIVDDHSEDDSYELVSDFAKTDPRITLLKTTGNGIIDALRLAYSKSSGDLITRMDSDDIMVPDKLETMVHQLISKGPGHVALGLVQYFSSEGISNGYSRYETWINTLTQEGKNYSDIYKECVIPSPCWLIHRVDLEGCDAFNPNRYPEDYDLTFRFYRSGLKCIPSNKILHRWRDYSTRTSRTHEHYAQNYFLDIKLHYFLELDHDLNRPLTIWGAGGKGKTIAHHLVDKGIPFYWICDNPKKIGKQIYGQELMNFSFLSALQDPQCIVTVANSSAQDEIQAYFNEHDMIRMKDYFFFC